MEDILRQALDVAHEREGEHTVESGGLIARALLDAMLTYNFSTDEIVTGLGEAVSLLGRAMMRQENVTVDQDQLVETCKTFCIALKTSPRSVLLYILGIVIAERGAWPTS